MAKTLWTPLREGSSDPDAFFRYARIAKRLTGNESDYYFPVLPAELAAAVSRIAPGSDPYKYLSYSVGDSFGDKTWRLFWFTYIMEEDTLPLYTINGGPYIL
jgi:hypothetical protein